VKICWISMLSPTKQILTKYKMIVIQLFNEQASHDTTKVGLEGCKCIVDTRIAQQTLTTKP
jgi:hypothetical protein